MKPIKAFMPQVRTPNVGQVPADAGDRNPMVQDVEGMLEPLNPSERSDACDRLPSVLCRLSAEHPAGPGRAMESDITRHQDRRRGLPA